jgi:hypothetical protein
VSQRRGTTTAAAAVRTGALTAAVRRGTLTAIQREDVDDDGEEGVVTVAERRGMAMTSDCWVGCGFFREGVSGWGQW